jgi:hypothetical protein
VNCCCVAVSGVHADNTAMDALGNADGHARSRAAEVWICGMPPTWMLPPPALRLMHPAAFLPGTPFSSFAGNAALAFGLAFAAAPWPVRPPAARCVLSLTLAPVVTRPVALRHFVWKEYALTVTYGQSYTSDCKLTNCACQSISS